MLKSSEYKFHYYVAKILLYFMVIFANMKLIINFLMSKMSFFNQNCLNSIYFLNYLLIF